MDLSAYINGVPDLGENVDLSKVFDDETFDFTLPPSSTALPDIVSKESKTSVLPLASSNLVSPSAQASSLSTMNMLFLVNPAHQEMLLQQRAVADTSTTDPTSVFAIPNLFLGGLLSNSASSTKSPTLPAATNPMPSALLSSTVAKTQEEKSAEPSLPPLRALSAYNFFFRDERDRIVYKQDHDWTQAKKEKLLQDHWGRDRTKKRRHRKTHGKIDFKTLSRLISQRWKELSEEQKDFYREVAARDWKRYQEELAEYKAARASVLTAQVSTSQVVG